MQVSAMTFTDVPPTHFAYSFIETFATSGITGGCAPETYCPDNPVSRAQMAIFLERAMNGGSYQPPPATGAVFLDVAATGFGAAFIEQFSRDGITGGCGGGNYCPSRPVTRAQMAVFILRAKYGADFQPPSATGQVFADVGAGDFAAAYIEQFSREGITGGCGGGNYCPNDVVTRAQMAVFLVKGFNLSGGGGGSPVTLSGSISAPASVAADSDTNDPDAPYASNDTPNDAQTIANPITLGGYVNAAGTGAEGRSKVSGDLNDFYRVELLAGQVITMLVSDFETADADLALYDSTGTVVDASFETGPIESLTVAADGTYFVSPTVFTGATNYVLIIGNAPVTSAGGMRLSSDIATGQAVVRYDTSLARNQAQSIDSVAAAAGFGIRAGAPGRPMLLERVPGAVSTTAHTGASAYPRASDFRNPEDRAKWETLMAIKALRADPSVVYAEPNYILQAMATPNDPYYPQQWHYPLINLPAAWDLETGDANVTVAVIDTGVLLNHPDMTGQLVPGYDFISDPNRALDGDGIDPNADDPGDSDGITPSSFHGTHVAGTVAAATNNNLGVAGVAWGVKIMPLRVLGVGGRGSTYDILQAVRYAAGLPNDSNTVPAQRADVMNLSLGGGGSSQAAQDAYTQARQAGVIIVAAAGNETTSLPSYPAAYEGVISVSAVDLERGLAWYSNFGTAIDVAAPGGDVRADRNADGNPDGVLSLLGSGSAGSVVFNYRYYNGTSMAAPHVAGVIALMKSANANVTPDIVDQQLIAGALTDDIGSPGRDDSFGHGLINARKAVTAALNLGGTPPPDNPTLGVTPSALNFDAATSAIEIVVRNTGTGNLQLNDILPDQPWITVTPITTDASNLGTFLVTVDRSGLADGIYSGQIALLSNVNTVNVSVVMTVGATGTAGDVGRIYVLLVDANSNAVVDEVAPTPAGGSYSYAFSEVPAGTYAIFAGSDSDNDLFICDPGEACGAYRTIDQPILLEVNRDQLDLDFSIGYIVEFPALNASADDVEKPERGIFRLEKQPSKAIAR
jgi:serine protease